MIIHYMDQYITSFKTILPLMFSTKNDFLASSQNYKNTNATYTPLNNLTAQIPFYGSIIGDFFLSVDADMWAVLINKSMGPQSKTISTSCLTELLNTVTGEAICRIAEDYPDLTYLSPRIIEGRMEYPAVERVSTLLHSNDLGKIELSLCIDMMKLDIHTKLDSIVDTIKDKDKMLIHSDRLSTLGTMAASLMHEINNPISFISGNVQILQDYYLPEIQKLIKSTQLEKDSKLQFIGEELPNICNGMMNGVTRIKNLTQKLKGFSRHSKADFTFVNINQCAASAVNFSTNSIPQNIQIVLDLATEMKTFYADEQQIEQILINLIINSSHALESHRNPQITISTSIEGEWVSCRVKDNGSGVKEEDLVKIWDPFFTTKEKGKGTGLGLAICREIISQLKGSIDYTGSSKSGAEFTLKLPIQEV